jgi:hypothetical protein
MSFSTANGSSLSERMRIDSSGLVSIKNVGVPTLRLENTDTSIGVQTLGSLEYYQSDPSATGVGVVSRINCVNESGFQGAAALTFETGDVSSITERMRINSSGNVGINKSPENFAQLEVKADTDGKAALLLDSNGLTQPAYTIYEVGGSSGWENGMLGTGDSYAFAFSYGDISTSSNHRMRLTSGGDLHVDGDVVAYSTTISDKRLKDNVKPLESSLDKVMNLKGVEYVWNNGIRKGQKDIGFIAQEVEEVIPEIVREKQVIFNEEEKYKTVDYEKITAVLVEAVKELTAKVERLENNKCNCK